MDKYDLHDEVAAADDERVETIDVEILDEHEDVDPGNPLPENDVEADDSDA